jgi:hypothetical protein
MRSAGYNRCLPRILVNGVKTYSLQGSTPPSAGTPCTRAHRLMLSTPEARHPVPILFLAYLFKVAHEIYNILYKDIAR